MPKNRPKPMWKPEAIGDVIAERQFVLTRPSGRKTRIQVRFGKPIRRKGASRADPWWCPVEVEGAGLDSFRPVAGIDALQALILALELASRVLPDEVERAGFSIEWLGDSERLVLARHGLSRGVENTMLSLFATLRDVAVALSSNEKEKHRATEALRSIANSAQLRRPRRRSRARSG